MKTYSAKKESVEREWCLVNADGKVLGRLAAEIARRLRGKTQNPSIPRILTPGIL